MTTETMTIPDYPHKVTRFLGYLEAAEARDTALAEGDHASGAVEAVGGWYAVRMNDGSDEGCYL